MILLLAAVGVAGLPLLLHPLGRDQGTFLLIGRAIARGGFPYVDLWDFKPPGLHLVHALPGLVRTGGGWPVGALDLLLLLMTAVGLQRRAARLGSPEGGGAAVILLAFLWLFGSDYWDMAQGERILLPLLLLALEAAESVTPRRWLLAGACAGFLPLLKTSMAPLALVLVPALLDGRRRQRRAAPWGWLLAGGVIPVTVVTLWLAAGGALGAALHATLSFTSRYTRLAWADPGTLLRTAAGTTLFFARTNWPLLLLAAAGALAARGWRRREGEPRAGMAPLWIWLVVGYATILAQGKFFPYHWMVLWPPLVLLAARGCQELGERALRRIPGRAPLADLAAATPALVAVALLFWSFAPGWNGWQASALRLTGQALPAEQRSRFRVQGLTYGELEGVAHALARRTETEEPIYLWGYEPAFYIAAGRTFPGRFLADYPLVAPWAPPAWQDEFLRDFSAAPPRFVVVRRRDPLPWVAGVPGDAATRLSRFPRLQALLGRDYRPEPDLSTRHLLVMKRVAGPPPGR